MENQNLIFFSRPSKKRIRYRYNRLLQNRIDAVAENISAYGIGEDVLQTEILLDDIIFEIDEIEEERRFQNETVKERDH